MNELSWLIYAADVAGDANIVCSFIFYAGFIALPIYALVKGAARAFNYDFHPDPVTPSIASLGKALWLPVVIAGVIGVAVPSSGTLYAIAASEMGEKVLNSETGGKAVEALNAWLDRQIAGNGGEQ